MDLGISSHITNMEVELLKGRVSQSDYLELLSKLNHGQRKLFTHIMNMLFMKPDETIRIFVTGGAGVGKSLLIKTLYQAMHRLMCSSEGQNPEHCRIIVCAFTGLAAYNVKGSTLHSAFGIEPNKKLSYKPLSDEKRNTMRVKYLYLSVVIIDEVSMVGNEMLKFIHLRLQEIKCEYQKPFGGVHLILVGDLFQLRPVCDGWIFEDCKVNYSSLGENLWRKYFTMYELGEIMRQKEDKEFAILLNRLREGNQTHDDISKLKSRSLSKTDNLYKELQNETHIFPLNKEVDSHNTDIFKTSRGTKLPRLYCQRCARICQKEFD